METIKLILSHHHYIVKVIDAFISSIPALLVAGFIFRITNIKERKRKRIQLVTELISLCTYRALTVFTLEKTQMKLKSVTESDSIMRFSDRSFDLEKILYKIMSDTQRIFSEVKVYITKKQFEYIKSKLLEVDDNPIREFNEFLKLDANKKNELHDKYMKEISSKTWIIGQGKVLLELTSYLTKEFTEKKKHKFFYRCCNKYNKKDNTK